jgi:hypothetical protein
MPTLEPVVTNQTLGNGKTPSLAPSETCTCHYDTLNTVKVHWSALAAMVPMLQEPVTLIDFVSPDSTAEYSTREFHTKRTYYGIQIFKRCCPRM